jgi:cytochrome oxidase Cu insertion factor (SCO1/SenC/PrrC family)
MMFGAGRSGLGKVGIALIAAGLIVLGVSRFRNNTDTVDTIDYGSVPDFSLVESSGRTVTLRDLQGKVWVADFIFTSCAGMCPMMSGEMQKLAQTLPREVSFVSFTVDPARDTPAVLAEYGKKFGADGRRWMFLTGKRQAIYDLSINGFKLGVDDQQGTEAEPITHSSRFVLVDRAGKIRGYYSGTEEADLTRLAQNAKDLL